MKPDKAKETSFDFCNKETKTLKEDLLCQQDTMHKSMVDNPLGFIIFYLLSILFIGFLFHITKISKKKEKKINTLNFLILILLCIHLTLIFLVLNIAKLFDIKKICLLFLKNSKKRFYFTYIYFKFFIFFRFFFKINGPNGLQIVNFLFSFMITFRTLHKDR